MRFAALLFVAASAYAQTYELGSGVDLTQPPRVTVRFIAIPMLAAAAQSGPGNEAGRWWMAVCNRTASPLVFHRQFALEAVPDLRVLDEDTTRELLTVRTKKNPWRTAGNILAFSGTLAGATIAAIGMANGNSRQAAIGSGVATGLQILPVITNRVQEEAVIYTLPKQLPETIGVGPTTCVEFNVLAAKMPGAKNFGPVEVRVP